MTELTKEQIKRQKALAWLKRVAYENPRMKEVKTCIEVLSAPAQPVSDPYKLPDGWKLVPIEPTAEMYEAGDKQITTKQAWDSMLAAAPTAQESE